MAKAYVTLQAYTGDVVKQINQAKPGIQKSVLNIQGVMDIRMQSNASGIPKQIKQAQPGIKSAVSGLAGSMSKILGAVGLALGIAKMISIMKDGIRQASERMEIEARLGQKIQITGHAAGFTAGQLRKQAEALAQGSTQSVDSIMRMQEALLPMKKITGEVFERTQQAAVNMAAAFGGDATSAAMKLARVLEDPRQSLESLRDVGVTFTIQQQKEIRNLLRSQQLYKAQERILEITEGRLKGVAEQMAKTPLGKLQKVNNAINAQKKLIGGMLLPVMTDWRNLVLDLMKKFEQFFPQIRAGYTMLVEFTKFFVNSFMEGFHTAFKYVSDLYTDLFPNMSGGWKDFIGTFLGNLDVALASFEGFGEYLYSNWVQTKLGFQAVWEQLINWFAVKMLEMRKSFGDVWDDTSKAVSEKVMPVLTRIFTRWEKFKTEMSGQKWTDQDEAQQKRQAAIDRKNLHRGFEEKKRLRKQETREALRELEKEHQANQAAIGAKVLAEDERWKQTRAQLPELSKMFGGLLKGFKMENLVKGLKDWTGGKPPEAREQEKAQIGSGQTGVAQFGASIQAAMLKERDPVLKENREQNKELKKQSIQLGKLVGTISNMAGGEATPFVNKLSEWLGLKKPEIASGPRDLPAAGQVTYPPAPGRPLEVPSKPMDILGGMARGLPNLFGNARPVPVPEFDIGAFDREPGVPIIQNDTEQKIELRKQTAALMKLLGAVSNLAGGLGQGDN